MRTPRPETPPNILPITTDAPPPQAATRRPFGDGPAVSLFTLGTMRALESPDAMEAVVRRAVAVGVNHIETAPSYGPAERYLGSALAKLALEQPAQRAELVLTSKILPSFDAAEAWGQVLASLERLGHSWPEHRGPPALGLAWRGIRAVRQGFGGRPRGSSGL
jgi:hypothetical protein